jgi:hypothetical protein
MRLTRVLCGSLFFLVCFAGQVFALGLYVERLQNPEASACPHCRKQITPGGIHENAENILSTQVGGYLAERGIPYTGEKGQASSLNVFVYRFQERQGGNFSVVRPASVGFHVHLYEGSSLVRVFAFDETQKPLSENVLGVFTFFKRGAKWITAGELAREGVHQAIDAFADTLKTEEK